MDGGAWRAAVPGVAESHTTQHRAHLHLQSSLREASDVIVQMKGYLFPHQQGASKKRNFKF